MSLRVIVYESQAENSELSDVENSIIHLSLYEISNTSLETKDHNVPGEFPDVSSTHFALVWGQLGVPWHTTWRSSLDTTRLNPIII